MLHRLLRVVSYVLFVVSVLVVCCCLRPVVCSPGVGVLCLVARVLVRAPIDGPRHNPIDTEDHTLRSPCSHAPLRRVTAASKSSPRAWAVSMGSHMQHGHFVGATTPVRMFRAFHCRNQDQTTGDNIAWDTSILNVRVSTRVKKPWWVTSGKSCALFCLLVLPIVIPRAMFLPDCCFSLLIVVCAVWYEGRGDVRGKGAL